MNELTSEQVRNAVRDHYGAVAKTGNTASGGCCGGSPALSAKLGYSESELQSAPEGANLGLGCGNPQAIAALRPGETVLDLGAGAGFDSFLAAKQVGAAGHVIGVDMTPEMVTKARGIAQRTGATNVEFRLGEIEHLPVADQSVDVILSNCVINLAPDKAVVYREAHRVLKPGGRLAISDVVALAPIPAAVANELGAISCCIGGAISVETTRALLRAAGFGDVRVTIREESRAAIREWAPGSGLDDMIASATIEATKERALIDARSDEKTATPCCGPSCCSGASK